MHDNAVVNLNDGLVHDLRQDNLYPDLKKNQLNDDHVELSDEQLP